VPEGPDSKQHVLIVTGPQRERLHRRFARLYAFSTDVLVRLDRRYRQRRRAAASREVERRRTERRVERPDWVFPPDDS